MCLVIFLGVSKHTSEIALEWSSCGLRRGRKKTTFNRAQDIMKVPRTNGSICWRLLYLKTVVAVSLLSTTERQLSQPIALHKCYMLYLTLTSESVKVTSQHRDAFF